MGTVYDRTRQLIGEEKLEKLKNSKVIVFGAGGVGGYVIEALARAGVGVLGIVDCDTVDITNINRQIIALKSTLGRPKTEVFAERIRQINDEIEVRPMQRKLTSESIGSFEIEGYDYVVDAIDDVPAKLILIKRARELGVQVISSMGTGNKLNPSDFRVSDIEETHTCPLAKKMRKELSRMGITKVKVVFSPEKPFRSEAGEAPASISFVPAAAGLLIAKEVTNSLCFLNK